MHAAERIVLDGRAVLAGSYSKILNVSRNKRSSERDRSHPKLPYG
jgi:hypothetical protein